jgi:hypothetical protein
MTHTVIVLSPNQEAVGRIDIQQAMQSWWFRDVGQFIEELDGMETCMVADMLIRYIENTRWMLSSRLCPTEHKAVRRTMQDLEDLVDLCLCKTGTVLSGSNIFCVQ